MIEFIDEKTPASDASRGYEFDVNERHKSMQNELAVVFCDERIGNTSEEGSEDRCDPEKPNLFERPGIPAGDTEYKCWPGATCWVDREVRHWDTDQVNEGQSKADSDWGESGRCSLVGRTEDDEQEEEGQHDFCNKC